MRIKFLVGFFIAVCFNLCAQKEIKLIDKSTGSPLMGATVIIKNQNIFLYTDYSGTTVLPVNLNLKDSVFISTLGYETHRNSIENLGERIELAPKQYTLKETIVKPLSGKDYIQIAFDSFGFNHVPFSFKQKVFYREEFIVNNEYLRFQEMDMEVYQFPKNNDKRKYYLSGSYPEVKQLYRIDNFKKLQDIKESMGKLVSKSINFNYMSFYSYTKGVNILNYIFMMLLDDEDVQFDVLGIDNIKGYNAIHIQGKHYEKKTLIFTSNIYLEESSYAVLHFSVLASQDDFSSKVMDFKTKALLWFLGIKIKINQFYTKIQFEKNQYGFWSVSDLMLMFPIEVKKKSLLDLNMSVYYRMNPQIERTNQPEGAKIYSQNQALFDSYKPTMRFGDKLNYAIPLVPIQQSRLQKAISK